MARARSTETEPQWSTVAEESASVIIMDEPGDQFTGYWLGEVEITPPSGESFVRLRFRGQDGDLYEMNKSFKLAQALTDLPLESQVRITLVKFLDLGREDQSPMKDYRVEVAR